MIYSKFLVVLIILLPVLTRATVYTPLVGVPGITGTGSLEDYLNTLYALSISIAALLAVIKIIIAGVKYMLSDVVTNKSSAIKDIQGALLGLILVVMAWVILYVINPAILSVTVNTRTIEVPSRPPETRGATRQANFEAERAACEGTPSSPTGNRYVRSTINGREAYTCITPTTATTPPRTASANFSDPTTIGTAVENYLADPANAGVQRIVEAQEGIIDSTNTDRLNALQEECVNRGGNEFLLIRDTAPDSTRASFECFRRP